jgi:release factor glutamine methyltransferase
MIRAERDLRAAGIPSAALEAELLLAHSMGISRQRLIAEQRPPSEEERIRWEAGLELRRRRYPLQYILGEAEFYSRSFLVRPGVAIPKSSTEALVAAALSGPFRRGCDVGTGTGIVAVSLQLERPSARMIAVDRSREALDLARENARRHSADVAFWAADLLEPLRGPFDLIVSNPPYIADEEWALVDPEVLHEPRFALSGGPDGLDVIRRLLRQGLSRLAGGGRLLIEVGFRQAAAVSELMRALGYRNVRVVQDGDGIPRVVGGER